MKLRVTDSLGQVVSCLVEQMSGMADVEFLALEREKLYITS
ncbi:hypothetical protein [Enterovibrio norvegicus]|nr:hypothetical protein [Enterovibrio norvegicus]